MNPEPITSMDAARTLPVWIDPEELEDLGRRYPEFAPAELARVLESHWPIRDEVESAIERLREARKPS